MLAQDLYAGAWYVENDLPVIVVMTDAQLVPAPFPGDTDPMVMVMVRYVTDGGQEPRYFNVDDEVPYS